MHAAMETLKWPGSVARPEFMSRESGVTMRGNPIRKRGATLFELWASLFSENFALLFNSRDDFSTGSSQFFLFSSAVRICRVQRELQIYGLDHLLLLHLERQRL
jgi:hypothetical protein